MYDRASRSSRSTRVSQTSRPAAGKSSATAQLPAHVAESASAGLGHDLSGVTVHQDGAAESLGTRAFARGDELHFAAGAYQPDSPGGLELIGHELAHVAQQRDGRVPPTGTAGGMAVNTDPSLEAEADASGAKVAQGFDLDGFLDFGTANAAPTTARGVATPVVQGEDLPAATTPTPVPPEIMDRVGAEFHHTEDTSAERHYRITPVGGFLLIAASDGRGVGKLEFRQDKEPKTAWQTLAAYVIAHAATIPPTVAKAPADPAAAPAGGESAAAPGFFDDPLGAIGNAVAGVVEIGKQVLGIPSQIISAAIDFAFGPAPSEEPAVPGATPAAPATGADPGAPASADMPALSQFRWYGSGGTELDVDQVFAAAQLINSELGLGGSVTHVTTPAADVTKMNANKGYFWFTAEGKACKDGNSGGTQYVTFTIDNYGKKANPLSAWLADNPPGQRPAEFIYDGKSHQASAELQNLASRNIPGGMACFATSQSMMAQAGVHAVGNHDNAEIRDIVASETPREYTAKEIEDYPDPATRTEKVRRQLVSVTVDAAKAEKARAYVDFETSNGRPVSVGITYTDRNCNDDGETDHWVVINAKTGANQFTFFDPGNNLKEDVASTSNLFVWSTDKGLHKEIGGTYVYVVSCIRPNKESLDAWSEHWAQLQAGQEATK